MDEKIDSLVRKYGTTDPFELVDKMDLFLSYQPLGNDINGVYFARGDTKLIMINSELPRHVQRFTLGHELAHHLLHANTNAMLLSMTDRQEYEADRFSIHLLLPEQELKDHPQRSIDDWAAILGLPREIVELRF